MPHLTDCKFIVEVFIELHRLGCVFVMAIGNEGHNVPQLRYPIFFVDPMGHAGYPGIRDQGGLNAWAESVMVVGATDRNAEKWKDGQADVEHPDILPGFYAPGGNVDIPISANGWGKASGTSLGKYPAASPNLMIAGTCADTRNSSTSGGGTGRLSPRST